MRGEAGDAALPSGWCSAKLGEILPLSYGKALPARSRVGSGAVSVFGSAGCIGTHSEALVGGPCIIVGRKGSAGSVYFSADPCWPIDTAYFSCPGPHLDARFAYYILLHQRLERLDQSTAIPSLGRELYSEIRVSLPPLSEQRRIAAHIEELYGEIEAGEQELEAARKDLATYRRAVLKAAVTGELTRDWREQNKPNETGTELLARLRSDRRRAWEEQRHPDAVVRGKPLSRKCGNYGEAADPSDIELADLPETWTWASLEQVSIVFVDSAHRTPRYGTHGCPALGPRDVVNGVLRLGQARLVDEDEYAIQTARHVPEPGDIVYSRELSYGWAAEIPEGARVCLSQGMCLFRPHRDVLQAYLLLVLNGPLGRQQAALAATGSAHPHINLSDIRAYRVPLPPVREQHEIVERAADVLNAIDDLGAALQAGVAAARAARASVLTAAFSGKLVSQDPADESASALLDRRRSVANTKAASSTRSGRRAIPTPEPFSR